jgi:hypothetical protein
LRLARRGKERKPQTGKVDDWGSVDRETRVNRAHEVIAGDTSRRAFRRRCLQPIQIPAQPLDGHSQSDAALSAPLIAPLEAQWQRIQIRGGFNAPPHQITAVCRRLSLHRHTLDVRQEPSGGGAAHAKRGRLRPTILGWQHHAVVTPHFQTGQNGEAERSITSQLQPNGQLELARRCRAAQPVQGDLDAVCAIHRDGVQLGQADRTIGRRLGCLARVAERQRVALDLLCGWPEGIERNADRRERAVNGYAVLILLACEHRLADQFRLALWGTKRYGNRVPICPLERKCPGVAQIESENLVRFPVAPKRRAILKGCKRHPLIAAGPYHRGLSFSRDKDPHLCRRNPVRPGAHSSVSSEREHGLVRRHAAEFPLFHSFVTESELDAIRL